MADDYLEIQQTVREKFIVVSVSGRLDSYNVQKFRDATIDTIKENSMVLDLAKLDFIASTGVGNLIELNETAEKNNKKLYLLGVQPNVFHVLKLTGFINMFTIVNSFDEVK